MTPEKRKELEIQLKRIFEQSFKNDLETVLDRKEPTPPRSVIRRRKGMPDKRIEIKPSEKRTT